jgi:hypothetical protein
MAQPWRNPTGAGFLSSCNKIYFHLLSPKKARNIFVLILEFVFGKKLYGKKVHSSQLLHT